jgi:hypothetical protein
MIQEENNEGSGDHIRQVNPQKLSIIADNQTFKQNHATPENSRWTYQGG